MTSLHAAHVFSGRVDGVVDEVINKATAHHPIKEMGQRLLGNVQVCLVLTLLEPGMDLQISCKKAK